MRILYAVFATAMLLSRGQQGMIPIVDTKPATTGPVFNPCLVSGWPMNEGSGTVLNDVSGNSNTANINNLSNASWGSNAGFPGSTLLYAGSISTNTTATSTTLANFDGTTPFSVSVWIKLAGTGQQTFLGTLQPGVYQGWELQTGITTNGLHFILSNTFSSNAIWVNGATNIQDGNKHFLVATYDGSRSASGVKLYVDGTLETMTVNANSLTATAATGRTVKIAAREFDGEAVNGVEAAAAIYNCVLTSTQVSTYNGLGPQIN